VLEILNSGVAFRYYSCCKKTIILPTNVLVKNLMHFVYAYALALLSF